MKQSIINLFRTRHFNAAFSWYGHSCETSEEGTVTSLFWHKNAKFRFIDIFCDSIKKMVLKRAITAKFKVNIQEVLCSFSDTASSRHHAQN